jgi:hypothetical protein
MFPLAVETIFQQQEMTLMSIESSLQVLGTIVGVGGVIMLIVVSVACTRLGNVMRSLRHTNELLRGMIAAEEKPAGDTPAATPGKKPPTLPPAPPKAEPDVYKL